MEIVYDEDSLKGYFGRAVRASPDHPVLIDSFLEDAFEADVDALSDGTDVVIGGIMQHIEDAGVHSGDSACVLPPYLLCAEELEVMRDLTRKFALELGVVGLVNVQFAIRDGEVYVLEVNPRASRTIPFVGKATGVPLARLAARVMAGETLADLKVPAEPPVRRSGGERGRVPLQSIRSGHPPRARDALHRRGHGHRRLLRHGLRQGVKGVGECRSTPRRHPGGECERPGQGNGNPHHPALPRLGFDILATRGTHALSLPLGDPQPARSSR